MNILQILQGINYDINIAIFVFFIQSFLANILAS